MRAKISARDVHIDAGRLENIPKNYQKHLAAVAPKVSKRATKLVERVASTWREVELAMQRPGTGLMVGADTPRWVRRQHAHAIKALRRYIRQLGGRTTDHNFAVVALRSGENRDRFGMLTMILDLEEEAE